MSHTNSFTTAIDGRRLSIAERLQATAADLSRQLSAQREETGRSINSLALEALAIQKERIEELEAEVASLKVQILVLEDKEPRR